MEKDCDVAIVQNRQIETFDLYNHLKKKDISNTFITQLPLQKRNRLNLKGTHSNKIIEVVEGALKIISYLENGEAIFSDILVKGDFYGNLKFTNETYLEHLIPVVDSKIRTYHLHYFKEQIVNDSEVAKWFGSFMSKSYDKIKNRMLNLSTPKVKDKIEFVKRIFSVEVVDTNGKSCLLIDLLSVSEIAQFAGTTRQTTSHFLQRKKKTGNMKLRCNNVDTHGG